MAKTIQNLGDEFAKRLSQPPPKTARTVDDLVSPSQREDFDLQGRRDATNATLEGATGKIAGPQAGNKKPYKA